MGQGDSTLLHSFTVDDDGGLLALTVDDGRSLRQYALSDWNEIDPAEAGEHAKVVASGGISSLDDLRALRDGALAGVGIVHLPCVAVREDVAAGKLVEMLPGWAPKCGIVHAIFPSRRGLLPSVRTLIDFLAEEFSQSDMA